MLCNYLQGIIHTWAGEKQMICRCLMHKININFKLTEKSKTNIEKLLQCAKTAKQFKYFKNTTKAILLSKDAGRMPYELAYMLENT